MEIKKIFFEFLTLCMLNSTYSTYLTLKSLIDDQSFTKSICKIVNDFTSSNADTQDVLIGNVDDKTWSSTINDIIQCINEETAVVVADLNTTMTETSLRKASVVILAFDWINKDRLMSLIIDQHQSKVWHHMAKCICILPEKITVQHAIKILAAFTNQGFYNVALVKLMKSNNALFLAIDSLEMNAVSIRGDVTGSMVFPDKLIDMKGFKYQIAVHHKPPRIVVGKKLHTALLYFLEALKSIQNSNYSIAILSKYMELRRLWINRMIHLTFNTDMILNSTEPKLLTYETNGYCALIPIPVKTSLTQIIFIEPFDGLTWMFLALSIVCCVAVFFVFRSRGAVDSPWLLGYGMFVYFIGQGVDFSRRNRAVLTTLIQLIILMIFVLSNAYEGVITSFMIQPVYEHRLKTVKDLLTSDYKIIAGTAFEFITKDDESFKAIRSRLKILQLNIYNSKELKEHKHVIMMTCDVADNQLTSKYFGERPMSDYYYKLPDPITTEYVRLEASFLNPLLERLQYFMDRSFQAGLPQIWKVFAGQESRGLFKSTTEDEVAYLKLQDLQQVFCILGIGCAIASLVLLFEILFHDCFGRLKLRHLASKLQTRVNQMAYKRKQLDTKYKRGALYYIIHRHQKVKRLEPKKLKVRQIFVQSN